MNSVVPFRVYITQSLTRKRLSGGLPLIILGFALLALALGLWMLKGKLVAIKNAIDTGFKTIEDGITANLLSPGSGLDRATDFLTKTSGMLDQIKTDMTDAKDVVVNDVVPIMQDSAQVIGKDVGQPVKATGSILTKVGKAIENIPLLGGPIGKPFEDAGNDLTDIGNKCIDIGNKIDDAAAKTSNIAQSIDSVSSEVKTVSDDFKAVVPLVNVTFRNGLQTVVNDLAQARNNLGQILSVVSNQLLVGLVVAGILFIAAGVALGP